MEQVLQGSGFDDNLQAQIQGDLQSPNGQMVSQSHTLPVATVACNGLSTKPASVPLKGVVIGSYDKSSNA